MRTTHDKNKILGDSSRILFFLTFGSVITLDLFTKYIAESLLSEPIDLRFFKLSLVHNFGAGFGILQGQRLLLILISLAVLGIILYYYPKLGSRSEALAAGMIAAGTLGNLTQRVLFGHVTDFIDLGFWPAFNIADISLCVGAGIIIFIMLKDK